MSEIRRAVITGLGIVSSIGNDKNQVLESLLEGRSGIVHCAEYAELEFRSHVHGPINLDPANYLDRKQMRFMGDAAMFACIAMQQAIEDARLNSDMVSNPRTGLVVGSGGASNRHLVQAADILRTKGAKKVGPYMVPRTMASTTSANLATSFGIKGINYSISSACSTSAHCIGNAFEQIQYGKQDIVFAGGGEEVDWSMTMLFDGMGALSSKYNNEPQKASRPFDSGRDGFVISGGGGIVVVEELEHALNRGAPIYAEIVGYGATSDGYDMVAPSGEGAVRCMRIALGSIETPVDYINAHGTGTAKGDIKELQAVKEVFPEHTPYVSSTKSLTGHALGAAGVNEAIFTLMMMKNKFVAISANLDDPDPEIPAGIPLVRRRIDNAEINLALSNSFGFGGTNCSLLFASYK